MFTVIFRHYIPANRSGKRTEYDLTLVMRTKLGFVPVTGMQFAFDTLRVVAGDVTWNATSEQFEVFLPVDLEESPYTRSREEVQERAAPFFAAGWSVQPEPKSA